MTSVDQQLQNINKNISKIDATVSTVNNTVSNVINKLENSDIQPNMKLEQSLIKYINEKFDTSNKIIILLDHYNLIIYHNNKFDISL